MLHSTKLCSNVSTSCARPMDSSAERQEEQERDIEISEGYSSLLKAATKLHEAKQIHTQGVCLLDSLNSMGVGVVNPNRQ